MLIKLQFNGPNHSSMKQPITVRSRAAYQRDSLNFEVVIGEAHNMYTRLTTSFPFVNSSAQPATCQHTGEAHTSAKRFPPNSEIPVHYTFFGAISREFRDDFCSELHLSTKLF